MIGTADFPQADKLNQVGEVVIAVANGNHDDANIEKYIGLGSGGRQGRYYRKAAEILGLIINDHNNSVLTLLGEEFSKLKTEKAKTDFLARCILETPVFKEALVYIYQFKPTADQLHLWFLKFYPGLQNTANRRFSTFMNYLHDASLVTHSGTYIEIGKYEGALVKKTSKIQSGLVGRKVKRSFTDISSFSLNKSIKFEIDSQKRDRANHIHWNLVTAKSIFLNNRGWPAIENEYIDLYSHSKEDFIIYEMKSISNENMKSQIRKSVSQLYEYRYVFSAPKAKLCIVTNTEIREKDIWLADYLANDRKIAYEWTADFEVFYSTPNSKKILGNFAP